MNTKCHNLTTVRNSFASKASSRADWWHGQFLSKTGHKLVGFRILPSAALRTTEASVVKMRPRNIFCVLCCLPTHSTALSSTSFKLSAMASADPVLGGSHSGCRALFPSYSGSFKRTAALCGVARDRYTTMVDTLSCLQSNNTCRAGSHAAGRGPGADYAQKPLQATHLRLSDKHVEPSCLLNRLAENPIKGTSRSWKNIQLLREFIL